MGGGAYPNKRVTIGRSAFPWKKVRVGKKAFGKKLSTGKKIFG